MSANDTPAIWSDWRPFPDPQSRGVLIAPFGPGCYDIRRQDTNEKVLFGAAGHVAQRMTSLLPRPLGAGTRDNASKREYVARHIGHIEYRTAACSSVEEAKKLERELRKNRNSYLFPT